MLTRWRVGLVGALLFYVLKLNLATYNSSPGNAGNSRSRLTVLVNACAGNSDGNVCAFHFGRRAKATIPLDSTTLPGPSCLIPSRSNRFICTIDRVGSDATTLDSLTFSQRAKRLHLLGAIPAFNTSPYCITAGNQRILATGCDNKAVSIFPLRGSNALTPTSALFRNSTANPSTVQRTAPRVRYAIFSPSKGCVFTASFDTSHVLHFIVRPSGPVPRTSLRTINVRTSSNPHRLAFDPGKGFTCLVARLSNGIVTFDCSSNYLRRVRAVATSAMTTHKDTSVRLDPSKGCLCTDGHLGRSNVTVFTIGPRGKALTGMNCRPANVRPHGFGVAPGNGCLLTTYHSDGIVRMCGQGRIAKLLRSARRSVMISVPIYMRFIDSIGGLWDGV